MTFPFLWTGLVDLEYLKTFRACWSSLGERVEPCAENDVLPHPSAGRVRDYIINETGSSHDRRPEQTRAIWVHVRTPTPPLIWPDKLESDVVLKYVRGSVDQQMKRTPQRDSLGGAFWPAGAP